MSTTLQIRPTTTVETDPQTLTYWRVIVFDLDAKAGGAIHVATVEAHTETEATALATAEAEIENPDVKSWGIWYIKRIRLEEATDAEGES
jgi:hypothetical protein